MGLDELHLRVLSTSSDDPLEKKNAATGTRIPFLIPVVFLLIFLGRYSAKASTKKATLGPRCMFSVSTAALPHR
jgi:hypothetical protein